MHFGWSVASAGDINSDGYDDIVVSKSGIQVPTKGKVYIYLGGENVDNIADIVIEDGIGDWNFGNDVSSAGDINNDGFDDIIVGFVGYDIFRGRVHIYYGGISMDNTVDVILNGNISNAQFGISVSSAGDINNDGYGDVIVGQNRTQKFAGKAYIYFGSDSMDNEEDFVFVGDEYDYWGFQFLTLVIWIMIILMIS